MLCLAALLLLSGATEIVSQNSQDGAACYSRFDYESKMLERIVMVEHRMTLLQENTKQELDKFGLTIKRMKKEQSEYFHDVTKRFDVLQGKLHAAQNMKLTELTAIGDDLKNTTETSLNENRLKHAELDAKFENMSNHILDELTQKHGEIVADVKVFTDDLDVKYKAQLDAMTAVEYDMKDLGENLKEEQSLKLQAMEAVGMDIKVDIQERMLKLEQADRDQKLEVAKVYQEFEETVNSTWDNIKVSGLGIKPAVAFNIRDVTNTNPSNNEVLKFTYVLTNTDSVYSSSTGLFTAPVNGTYWFSVHVCGVDSSRLGFRIVHNNDKDLSDSSTSTNSYVKCVTSSAVAMLNDGDTVCVKASQDSYNRRYYHQTISSTTNARTAFMGALVH